MTDEVKRAPVIPGHHHIKLSEHWELIQREDGHLLLGCFVGPDRWLMDLGESEYDDPRKLEEGVRVIMTGSYEGWKLNG